MKKVFLFYLLEVIIERNLKIVTLKNLVMNIGPYIHIIFDESNDLPLRKRKVLIDADDIKDQVKKLTLDSTIQVIHEEEIQHDEAQGNAELEREWRYVHNTLKS